MADIQMILDRDANGRFQLWACRGAGKGCKRNRHRINHKRCDDCFGPLPEDMTLGEVEDRLKAGDA